MSKKLWRPPSYEEQWGNYVHITIVEALDLPKRANKSATSAGDPFCIVKTFGGNIHKVATMKTRPLPPSANPIWNHSHVFHILGAEMLNVGVWHKMLVGRAFVGNSIVVLPPDVERGQSTTALYPIYSQNRVRKGSIRLTLRYLSEKEFISYHNRMQFKAESAQIKKIFGIEDDFIKDYSCSVEKRGLVRTGTLFVTRHWLLFYSSLGVKLLIKSAKVTKLEMKSVGKLLSTDTLNVVTPEKVYVFHSVEKLERCYQVVKLQISALKSTSGQEQTPLTTKKPSSFLHRGQTTVSSTWAPDLGKSPNFLVSAPRGVTHQGKAVPSARDLLANHSTAPIPARASTTSRLPTLPISTLPSSTPSPPLNHVSLASSAPSLPPPARPHQPPPLVSPPTSGRASSWRRLSSSSDGSPEREEEGPFDIKSLVKFGRRITNSGKNGVRFVRKKGVIRLQPMKQAEARWENLVNHNGSKGTAFPNRKLRKSSDEETTKTHPIPVPLTFIAFLSSLFPFLGKDGISVVALLYITFAVSTIFGGIISSSSGFVAALTLLSLSVMMLKPTSIYLGLIFGSLFVRRMNTPLTQKSAVFVSSFSPIVTTIVLTTLLHYLLSSYLPGFAILGIRAYLFHVFVTCVITLKFGVAFSTISRRFSHALSITSEGKEPVCPATATPSPGLGDGVNSGSFIGASGVIGIPQSLVGDGRVKAAEKNGELSEGVNTSTAAMSKMFGNLPTNVKSGNISKMFSDLGAVTKGLKHDVVKGTKAVVDHSAKEGGRLRSHFPLAAGKGGVEGGGGEAKRNPGEK
eukprot:TRINITY_DN7022_c0_g1_i1.p1 TRINITY_DN7022_c0_g1~~TRINITY_DN7022_c0_g1_i1.p1  ORF type:complete len:798 (+),score=133.64 TRINITY_DN7022_c0_g1_i1:213-2606(+)